MPRNPSEKVKLAHVIELKDLQNATPDFVVSWV